MSAESQMTERERKLNWEKGQVDYLGQDAFTNIQAKLDAALDAVPPHEETVVLQAEPKKVIQPQPKKLSSSTRIEIKAVKKPDPKK